MMATQPRQTIINFLPSTDEQIESRMDSTKRDMVHEVVQAHEKEPKVKQMQQREEHDAEPKAKAK